MQRLHETLRQRIMQLLQDNQRSSHELAILIDRSARDVEHHLAHVKRSLDSDQQNQFTVSPVRYQHCGFVFRGRKRLTCPSRCPTCKGEHISPPRFRIISKTAG